MLGVKGLPSIRASKQDVIRCLVGIAVLLLVCACWLTFTYYQDAQLRHQQESERLAWVKEARQFILVRRAESTPAASPSKSLITTVTETAKQFGVNVSRYKPTDESRLQLWLEQVPINAALKWIDNMYSNYGINVVSFTLSANESAGHADIQLTVGQINHQYAAAQ